MYSAELLELARPIFDYLYLQNLKVDKSDLIIGFGHFDLKIPKQCAALYHKGLAKKILFTGGRGAGSADFREAEAIEFYKICKETVPLLPENIFIEKESTNTGENIFFSENILRNLNPDFCFTTWIPVKT